MTVTELVNLCSAVTPALQSRVPVLFHVPALPLEAGDKLPTVAEFDADGSLVVEVDTAEVYLIPGSNGGLVGSIVAASPASVSGAVVVEAFERYADHEPNCPGLCASHPCTCGYSEAREIVRRQAR